MSWWEFRGFWGGFCKGLSEHGFGGLAEAFFVKHDDVQRFGGGIAVIGDGGNFDCVFQVAVIASFLPRVLYADGGQIAQAVGFYPFGVGVRAKQ